MILLTDDGGRCDWSPDGQWIAFDRQNEDGWCELWVIHPDGTGQVKLPLPRGGPTRHVGNPAWHPSGRYMAFMALNESFSSDNPVVVKLTDPGTGLANSLWLAKMTTRRGVPSITSIREVWHIPDTRWLLQPHWSSDGQWLAWSSGITTKTTEASSLYVGRLSTFPWLRLTDVQSFQPQGGVGYEVGSWSPDGRVLYAAYFRASPLGWMDLYSLHSDGGVTPLLVDQSEWDEFPKPGPSGKISYVSTRGATGGTLNLWWMNADGSGQEQLTFFTGGEWATDHAWHGDRVVLKVGVPPDPMTGGRLYIVETQ